MSSLQERKLRSSTNFLRSFAVRDVLSPTGRSKSRISVSESIQEDLALGDLEQIDSIFQNYMSLDSSDEAAVAPTKLKTGIASGLFLDDSVKSLNINQAYPDHLSVNCLNMKFPKPEYSDVEPDCGLGDAARFQEIFVDLASLHTASMNAQTRHVLDDRFSTFLGEGEKEFKTKLLNLLCTEESLSSFAKDTAAYERLQRFLQEEMGLDSMSQSQKEAMEKVRNLRGSVAAVAETDGKAVENRYDDTGMVGMLVKTVKADEKLARSFAFCKKGDDGKPSSEEIERLLKLARLANPALKVQAITSLVQNPDKEEEAQLFHSLFKVPGHVFVVNGSVCDISCDAFLMPVGGNVGLNTENPAGTIFPQWLKKIRERHADFLHSLLPQDAGGNPIEGPLPLKFYEGNDRVTTLENWNFVTPPLGTAHVPFLVAGG
jgi:hypothetical protein